MAPGTFRVLWMWIRCAVWPYQASKDDPSLDRSNIGSPRPVECLSAEGGPPVSSPEGLSCCAGDQRGLGRARPQAAPNWTKEICKPLWLLTHSPGGMESFPIRQPGR